MRGIDPETMSLAVEDVFDYPAESGMVANAGTSFLAQVREGFTDGSPLRHCLAEAGFHDIVDVPSAQFVECHARSSPLAHAVKNKEVRAGIGLDHLGGTCQTAARHGLYSLRFYDEAWLGKGCISLSPSLGAIVFVTEEIEILQLLCTRLLGLSGDSPEPGRVLNLSGAAIALEDPVRPLLGVSVRDDDPELSAWLRQRCLGAKLACQFFESKESRELMRPWIEMFRDKIPEVLLCDYERATAWGEAASKFAYEKQSEALKTFRELFANCSAIIISCSDEWESEGAEFSPASQFLSSLARIPVLTVPVADGGSMQLCLRDLDILSQLGA